MPDAYNDVLALVAENPGLEANEIAEVGHDIKADRVHELLQRAQESGDVLNVNGKYWVKRTGKYAFDVYDHPET